MKFRDKSSALTTKQRAIATIDRLSFGTILFTVIVVPLIFPISQAAIPFGEFKSLLLHLGALVIVASLSLDLLIRKQPLNGSTLRSLVSGTTSKRPDRIIVAGLMLLLLAQAISTVLSPLPRISMFGVHENYSGFSLYDSIALLIIFSGSALKFRTINRIKALAIGLAIGGGLTSIYGFAQHLGWDPLGGRQDSVRILSSFGNTLNFAGFLVLTIPVTLTMSFFYQRQRFLLVAVVFSILLGLQFAALWLTGGRGPLGATVVGLAMLLTMFVFGFGKNGITSLLKTLGTALIVAILLVLIPSPRSVDGLNRIASIGEDISSLTGESEGVTYGGLNARTGIWRTVISLSVNPQVPQDEPVIKTSLRPIFGLGPDMFVHSYPLVATPRDRLEVQVSAHNLILHLWVTSGLLGLASLLVVLWGLVITNRHLFRKLREKASDHTTELLLACGFCVAIVGKAVDMQAGVPRISDLAPTFVILGALVATYRVAIWGSVRESGTFFKEQTNVATVFPFNFLVMTSLSVTLFATLTLLFIGWDVRRVSASTIVAGEQNNEIFEKLTLAQQRAPDRSSWTFRLSEELFIASNVAHSNGLIADGNRLAIQARELLLESEKRNPYSMDTQLALATIATTMVQRGNSDFASELLERHARIAKYYPMFPSLVGTAATAAASVGEFELAIELADQAISTESETQNWSKAWYAKGASLVLLGQVEQGIAALLIATEKEPGSQGAFLAHQVLAKVYEQQGDHDRAEFHRDQIATD